MAEPECYTRRCRRVLKVRGAECIVMHTVPVKIFRPRPLWANHAHFAQSRLLSQCSKEFLNERTNSKSSRVDLAATYSHTDSKSGLVKVGKSVL